MKNKDWSWKNKIGRITRQEFCRKYKITQLELSEMLVSEGYLEDRLISSGFKGYQGAWESSENRKMMPTDKADKYVKRIKGSLNSGTYVWDENFLLEIYNSKRKIED